MDTPLVVVVAGPNGAGKSTTAPRLLRGALAVTEFVNADDIAHGLSAFRNDAGEPELRALAANPAAQGYRAHITFLSLPSADLAVARVAERVRQGGHNVPEAVIRRRFEAGLANFFVLFEPVADSWQMFDNSGTGMPRLVARKGRSGHVTVADPRAWRRLQERRS
jgi:predicted ABC-type ATPase